jgi:hypothetical protein
MDPYTIGIQEYSKKEGMTSYENCIVIQVNDN